jgi:hypothetical protein
MGEGLFGLDILDLSLPEMLSGFEGELCSLSLKI